MKFPKPQSSGIGTTGVVGVALMTLHLLDIIQGWGWPILYVLLILIAMGQENRKG